MRKLLLLLLLTFCHLTAPAQTERVVNVILHDVKPGETIRLISRKYLVTPADIDELNKFAVDGVRAGMVLQIPAKNAQVIKTEAAADNADPELAGLLNAGDPSEVEAIMDSLEAATDKPSRSQVSHKVLTGETLSAISRKYGVPVAKLQSDNKKILEKGLKAGQVIVIPQADPATVSMPENGSTAVDNPPSHQNITHIVGAKETLYSISKKYNVPVDEIKRLNEQLLAHGLQAGQVIKIKTNN